MAQQLSLSARPRRFAEMISQQNVTEEIRNYHEENGDLPVSMMFTGPSGVGKTSLARLCAVSLECPHSTEFGNPCKECYWAFIKPEEYGTDDFNIDLTEVNCADMSADELRGLLSNAIYAPSHGARFRTYILDELQSLSKQAQRFLFKTLEESPDSTKFYLCTSEPEEILEAIQNRCVKYELRALNVAEVQELVERLLTKKKSDLDPTVLADLLCENRVWSHRAVTQAVTKYLSGATPADAASSAGLESLDTGRICRYVTKGDWSRLRDAIQDVEDRQARLLRNTVSNYMRSMLLAEDSGEKRKTISKGIVRLAQAVVNDNGVALASVSAALWDVTAMFERPTQQ